MAKDRALDEGLTVILIRLWVSVFRRGLLGWARHYNTRLVPWHNQAGKRIDDSLTT
jgi:hypothetical protein